MSNVIKVKRGVDIKLEGEAVKEFAKELPIETIAVKPPDFHGARFKLSVKEGDEVKAGSPLLFNKDAEQVKFCSPVSGEVAQIVRGAKRRILEVRVLADKEIKYVDFGPAKPSDLERDAIIEKLTLSGCWPLIRQRPYNVVANTEIIPKNIFISGFDSAPLAPDIEKLIEGEENNLQAGIDALSKLTSGKIHVGLNTRNATDSIFKKLKGIEITEYSGPHPAGLVGVHIHHIAPINKGEFTWTVSPEHLVIIGRLFNTGKFDARINIAVAGSEVKEHKYHKTILGAPVKHFVLGNISDRHNRIISGNVLTGSKVETDGYLGAFDRQITVIPEGDELELFGWLLPRADRFSLSRTLPAWMFPNKKFVMNTNTHGEERAYVMTGEYEKVFPFDIYPVQLVKAILTKNIEDMENLGLYEVVEEDFALCEVVCTSKTPVQQIVREGIDLLQKEVG